jgi:hypothetical protein
MCTANLKDSRACKGVKGPSLRRDASAGMRCGGMSKPGSGGLCARCNGDPPWQRAARPWPHPSLASTRPESAVQSKVEKKEVEDARLLLFIENSIKGPTGGRGGRRRSWAMISQTFRIKYEMRGCLR